LASPVVEGLDEIEIRDRDSLTLLESWKQWNPLNNHDNNIWQDTAMHNIINKLQAKVRVQQFCNELSSRNSEMVTKWHNQDVQLFKHYPPSDPKAEPGQR